MLTGFHGEISKTVPYSNALANITRCLIGYRQYLRQYIPRYTVGNPKS